MKILTLNKKQEKKLLSLCKEFFPEFILVWPCPRDPDKGEEFEDIFMELEGKKERYAIHWYQLCLTELPKRILHRFNDKGNRDGCGSGIYSLQQYVVDSPEHPVDFLYEFVKECKKNKYFK